MGAAEIVGDAVFVGATVVVGLRVGLVEGVGLGTTVGILVGALVGSAHWPMPIGLISLENL